MRWSRETTTGAISLFRRVMLWIPVVSFVASIIGVFLGYAVLLIPATGIACCYFVVGYMSVSEYRDRARRNWNGYIGETSDRDFQWVKGYAWVPVNTKDHTILLAPYRIKYSEDGTYHIEETSQPTSKRADDLQARIDELEKILKGKNDGDKGDNV